VKSMYGVCVTAGGLIKTISASISSLLRSILKWHHCVGRGRGRGGGGRGREGEGEGWRRGGGGQRLQGRPLHSAFFNSLTSHCMPCLIHIRDQSTNNLQLAKLQ
jgi:hypothetical protein